MNLTRIVILCVAAIAAGAAALLVRGMLGGGTPEVQASLPPPQVTVEVLVASRDIKPGRALDVDSVHWEAWPKTSVTEVYISRGDQPDIDKAVAGLVVRSALVAGQPITTASIVRAGSAGFMAATIAPGMRAVSLPITAETGAGGFILPSDRVDVILTRDLGESTGQKNFQSFTILRDVRVLAIDQTAQQPKDTESAVGKTATLELTPSQSELIGQARQQGILSLALRPLGDSTEDASLGASAAFRGRSSGGISVIRYGVLRNSNAGVSERVPQ